MPANSNAAENPSLPPPEKSNDPKLPEAPQPGPKEQKLLDQLAANDADFKSNDTIDPDKRLAVIAGSAGGDSGGDKAIEGDYLQKSKELVPAANLDIDRVVATYGKDTNLTTAANDEQFKVAPDKQLAVTHDAKDLVKPDTAPSKDLAVISDAPAKSTEMVVPEKELTPEDKLELARQNLDAARHDYVKAGHGFAGKIAKMFGSEATLKTTENYNNALKDYQEASMVKLEVDIAGLAMNVKNPETGKSPAEALAEATMRGLSYGEFVQLQDEELKIKEQKLADSKIPGYRSLIDKYSKAKNYITETVSSKVFGTDANTTWGKKMAAAGAVGFGINSLTAMMTGGASVGVMRVLGGAAAAEGYQKGAEEFARKMREKRGEKNIQAGMQEVTKGEGGIDINKVRDWVDNQTDSMDSKFQNLSKARIGRGIAAIGAAVGISIVSRNAAEYVGEKLHAMPSAEAATTDAAETPPPPPAENIQKTPITHDVKKGDNLWNIIDQKLGEQSQLDEGERTHAIDDIKDKFDEMSDKQLKEIGITSGDFNKLDVGDKLDLTSVMQDQADFIKEADAISDAKAEAIVQNNEAIKEFFAKHPDIPASSGNIDVVLAGHGDTLTGRDALPASGNEPHMTTAGANSTEEFTHKPVAEQVGPPARVETLNPEQKSRLMTEIFGSGSESTETIKYLASLSETERNKLLLQIGDYGVNLRDYALAGQQLTEVDKDAFTESMMGKQIDDVLNNQSGNPSEQKYSSEIRALVAEAEKKLHADGKPGDNEKVRHYVIRVITKAHDLDIELEESQNNPETPEKHPSPFKKSPEQWTEAATPPQTEQAVTNTPRGEKYPQPWDRNEIQSQQTREYPKPWNTANIDQDRQNVSVRSDTDTAHDQATQDPRVRVIQEAQAKELKYQLEQEANARHRIEMAEEREKQKSARYWESKGRIITNRADRAVNEILRTGINKIFS